MLATDEASERLDPHALFDLGFAVIATIWLLLLLFAGMWIITIEYCILPFILLVATLLLITLSQLAFLCDVEDGRFKRKPNRVLRMGAPVTSFRGGDKRGVESPLFLSLSVSNDSTTYGPINISRETVIFHTYWFFGRERNFAIPEFPLLSPMQPV